MDNKKLYRDIKLWMISHPEFDLKLNKEIKSKKRELLDLFIKNGGESFDKNKLDEMFQIYLKHGKKISSYDSFAKFDVDCGMSLKEYVFLLNYMIKAYEDIKPELSKYGDDFYSEGEKSIYFDSMKTRFNQYQNQFEMGEFSIRTLLLYFILKDKLDIKSGFDFENTNDMQIKLDSFKFDMDLVVDLLSKTKF